MKLKVLEAAADSLDALEKLYRWADTVQIAYAWASTSEGRAEHWRRLDVSKITRAVIGTQFAQTEPWVLRELDKVPNRLRVAISSEGTFHPKVTIGRCGKEVRVVLGSSNLTAAGLSTNTELNVLLEAPSSDQEIERLVGFVRAAWAAGEPLDSKWLAEYEVAWKRRPRAAGLVPQSGLELHSVESLDVGWEQYVDLILKQENRKVSSTFRISVLGDGISYLSEFNSVRAAFASNARFQDMSLDERRRTIGMGDASGLLGTMQAAGDGKKVVLSHPDRIGRYLDELPIKGEVSETQVAALMDGMTAIKGVSIGVASRLLVAKRPDIFISVNNGSRPALGRIMGRNITTVRHYIEVLRVLWSMPWFKSLRPLGAKEQIVWDHRVAILDAALYEQV